VYLGRYSTPCPSSRVESTYLITMWSVGTFPFWACLISRLAGHDSRRFNHTFAFAAHSHLLGASPLSASSLSPSCPCTPTFENQSPAVGQCCHSSTWRIGVDGPLTIAPIWTHSCEGSSRSKTAPFLLILPDAPCEHRFRANGSHDKDSSVLQHHAIVKPQLSVQPIADSEVQSP
jgi:hypothetical protein